MPDQPCILVIEDDKAIRRGIIDALRFESFHTFEAADAEDGRRMAQGVECDLILLDLLLPEGDGLAVLREVREVRPALPVIILTARGDEKDRVKGLAMGADDYVVKPFSVRELIARIRAVLRRSPGRPGDVQRLRLPVVGAEVDFQRREVRYADGRRQGLSDLEAQLLRYLACRADRAVSREELLRNVWRIDPAGTTTRTVDMQIARLREKLGDSAEKGRVLRTVRGCGYVLACGGGAGEEGNA